MSIFEEKLKLALSNKSRKTFQQVHYPHCIYLSKINSFQVFWRWLVLCPRAYGSSNFLSKTEISKYKISWKTIGLWTKLQKILLARRTTSIWIQRNIKSGIILPIWILWFPLWFSTVQFYFRDFQDHYSLEKILHFEHFSFQNWPFEW